MRNLFLIYLFLILSKVVFCQKWNNDIYYILGDTTIAEYKNGDIFYYKALICESRSKFGLRIEFANSNYYYSEKTSEWLGQHGGPNFNFILTRANSNFGFRFKPWTINPSKDLAFDGVVLPQYADLNPVKLDLYYGYSLNLKYLISFEPYIGYSKSVFSVINQDVLNAVYEIPSVRGIISGCTLNKYFRIRRHEYITVFGSFGYGLVDFSKVHIELDKGYYEWNIGIAYKFFFLNYFYKDINEFEDKNIFEI